jgi:hypothetical protein
MEQDEAPNLQNVSSKSEDLDLASPIITWESPSKVMLSSRLPCRLSDLVAPEKGDLESSVAQPTKAQTDALKFEEELKYSSFDAITMKPTDSSPSKPGENVDATRNCYMNHNSEPFGEKASVDSQSSPLCKDCQNVFDHWTDILRDERGAFRHCASRVVLEQSAEAGCYLCAQFLKAVQSEWLPTENLFPDFIKLCGLEMDWTNDETSESGFLVLKKGPDIIFDPFPALEREVFGNDDWMISLLFFPKTHPGIEILDVKMSPTSPSGMSFPLPGCQITHQWQNLHTNSWLHHKVTLKRLCLTCATGFEAA